MCQLLILRTLRNLLSVRTLVLTFDHQDASLPFFYWVFWTAAVLTSKPMQPSNFRSSCCCVRVEPYFCDQGWRLFKAKRCSELRNRHHGRNLHVDFVRKVWSADRKSVPFLVNQWSKILDVKTSSTDCEAHVYPRLEVSKQLFHHFCRNICRIYQIWKKVSHFRDKRGLPDKCVTL